MNNMEPRQFCLARHRMRHVTRRRVYWMQFLQEFDGVNERMLVEYSNDMAEDEYEQLMLWRDCLP